MGTSPELDGRWIVQKLHALADATRLEVGIWRAAYTREDRIAKDLVAPWLREAGLAVYEDAAGNLYGRLEGDLPGVILAGSHLDSVKNGGLYDGACGIITALAAIKNLLDKKGRPRKSIEVICLMEEEGSRYEISYIGSKAITGALTPEDLLEKDADGVLLRDALRDAGYDPDRYREAVRDDLDGYVELHIEQGPVLDKNKLDIGVVEHIVGIFSWELEIRGEQNHAGTTPMNLRKDPVSAAAQLITALTNHAKGLSKTATVTVGKMQAFPGMSNVIPDRVFMTVDMRDAVKENLLGLKKFLEEKLQDLEADGFGVFAKNMCHEMPSKLDGALVDQVEAAAIRAGAKYLRMNSGAGHDAQIFAEKIPACMIFIPSKDGISHSPREYTQDEQVDMGRKVMEETLARLAWRE
jgi:hydantoinase/carbamoylase family amidase